MQTTDYKITELFCVIDDFCKHFEAENGGKLLLGDDTTKRRRRKASLSDSEIMTILLYFHFGTFRNFKHYYLFFIKGTFKTYFPNAVSYNRFVELESRVFFPLMFFLNLRAFGRCTGITFVDSTMIPVCHNLRRYANKVFKGVATNGKGTMGWCHGFKLHLACNDRGEIIAFVLTGANVSDKDTKVFKVLAFRLQAKANFLRFLSVACKRNTVFRVFCISLASDVFSLFSVLHWLAKDWSGLFISEIAERLRNAPMTTL